MTSFSNANRVCATISPVKKPMTLISIIREEGRRLAETHCGFKYLMAWLGTCDDFEAGRIPFIRLKQSPSLTDVIRRGGKVTYTGFLEEGKKNSCECTCTPCRRTEQKKSTSW